MDGGRERELKVRERERGRKKGKRERGGEGVREKDREETERETASYMIFYIFSHISPSPHFNIVLQYILTWKVRGSCIANSDRTFLFS